MRRTQSTRFLGAVLLLATVAMSGTARADAAKSFYSLWYDGNAEISTYALKESRYGEIREGQRVMVFVTEPMRRSTHIKPDVKLPPAEQVKVIKLNDLRKFPTGIYDYSVMTSVFAAVEEKPGIPLLGTMKVAFTGQEWCGTVFERYLREGDTYEGVLYSYFESDGETTYSVPVRGEVEAEETLWLRIRELKGPWLREGESRKMRLIPAVWDRRKRHVPASVVDAVVTKGSAKDVKVVHTALGKIPARPFAWKTPQGTTTVWVEDAWPHRILSWSEADGSSGTLLASRREPYWKRHGTEDIGLRDSLRLSK